MPGLDLLPAREYIAVPEIKDPVPDAVYPLPGITQERHLFFHKPQPDHGFEVRVHMAGVETAELGDGCRGSVAKRNRVEDGLVYLELPELLREDKVRFVVKVPVPVEKLGLVK